MMLMVPDWLDEAAVKVALERSGARNSPTRRADVRLDSLSEGRCVQTLHVGPFDTEGSALERMHEEFIPSRGLRLAGTHHEIYLSDFRRSTPERLRTILRQPVGPA